MVLSIKQILCWLSFTLLCSPVFCETVESPVNWLYWPSQSETSTIDDARIALEHNEFKPLVGNINRGFTSRVSWVTAQIDTHAIRHLYLSPSYLQDIKFYWFTSDGLHGVIDVTANDLGFVMPRHSVEIPRLSGRFISAFIRLQTNTTHIMAINAYTEKDFVSFRDAEMMSFAARFTILGVISFITLLLWVRLRQTLHLSYSLYLLGVCGLGLAESGLNHVSSWFAWLEYFDVGHFVGLSYVAMACFLKTLFETPRHFPRLNVIVWLNVLFGGLVILLAGSTLYSYIMPYMYVLGILLVLAALYMAVQGVREDSSVAGRSFLLAFGISCVGIVVTSLTLNGVLPANTFTINAYANSVLIQSILMMAIFAEQMMFAEHRALRLAMEAERRAEQIADEMTQEIKVANSELEAALTREKMLRKGHENFIQTVNHEYRTPLAIIKGYMDMFKLVNTNTDINLDKVFKAIDRLQGIFTNSLDVYRLTQAGPVAVEFIDLIPFLSDVIDESLINHGIDFDYSSSSLSVYSDREALRIALFNLLTNADKYFDDKAENAKIRLEVMEVDKDITLRISNPCNPRTRPKDDDVFSPYTRGVNLPVSGLGYGLYLVQLNIEKVGGSIVLDDTPRDIFSLSISLPRAS